MRLLIVHQNSPVSTGQMGERARQRVLERYDLHRLCLPRQRALVLGATSSGG